MGKLIGVAIWTVVAALSAAPLGAQRGDTVTTREVIAGVRHTRAVRIAEPWIINVLRVDLRRAAVALRPVRAHDALRGRERVSDMARRLGAAGDTVIAALNADFFDLKTGENENNFVLNGEWWKGLKITESPFDTWDNPHVQFGADSAGHLLMGQLQFMGEAVGRSARIPLLVLNARGQPGPEGTAFFTPRFGERTATDTGRTVAELPLRAAGRRGDSALFVVSGASTKVAGSEIPRDGAVLAGYGPRAAEVAAVGAGETLAVWTGVMGRGAPRGRSPLSYLVGGWPQIVRDGASVAQVAAQDEGTISRNAEVRHPRSAVGFSRDSSVVFLVSVDGRSRSSAGMTTVELAALMRELGAWQAMNFDGGGSTTMVVEGHIVNSPADQSGEREVGNALMLVRHARMPRR